MVVAPVSQHNHYQLLIFVAMLSVSTDEVVWARLIKAVDGVAVPVCEVVERLVRAAVGVVFFGDAQNRVVISRIHKHCRYAWIKYLSLINVLYI